jgi:hypothetical protein
MSSSDDRPDSRQRIQRVPGARRAKLTPAPGTEAEPTADAEAPASDPVSGGPNDERMRQDVPPHY